MHPSGIQLLTGVVVLVISIALWWVIFSRAGYSGARSLLMLIPIVNVVIFLMFVFSEWPVQKEVKMLRQQLVMNRPGMYPPQGPQVPPYPPYRQ
ncbi:hypothetical protein KSC_105160 [Ktedonobacter sp. SOSP1-52]|uniref:hypothetical protein n=1 Tax=Ktedonobacter sp. SOSP1-52 TaxID=2778366 RepID=UPI001916B6C8|nr:hypothetical protein [Ktedonobacter sp. SOSP1-52]GHO71624.1 hypothetical protein KSC_105160 [Ktedonobacter sp. SOSP1-52]